MRITRFVVAAFALAVIAVAQDSPLFLEQKPDATVAGLDITLADLCHIEGLEASRARSLSLGPGPQGGRSLMVGRDTILRTLAEAKISLKSIVASGSESTRVAVRTVTFSGDEIRRMGQGHIRERLGDAAATARFGKTQTPPDFTVAAGRYSTRLAVREPKDVRLAGAMTLEAVAIVDGVERERLAFVVDVRRKGKVAIAAHDLSMGAILKIEDVTYEDRELTAESSELLTPDRLPVGATIARRIGTGTVLTPRDLRARPVVERGDTVTLRFKSGPLTVTGIGRTQGPGAPGDRIAVINTASNKVVYGVVVDSRTVDVAPQLPNSNLNSTGDLK